MNGYYFVYGKSGQLIFEKAQVTKAYFYLENQPLAMITNQSQAIGAFYLENKYTGYRIAAPNNTQGARLITVAGSTNSPEAQFEKVLKDDNYFYLKNKATGFHMRPVSNADGSTLEQVPNTYIGNRTQWFDALSTDGNFLHLRNRWTGKNIRPINDTLGNQIEIRPTHWSGNWTQWTLVPVLESQSTKTEIYYYHNDHLGTPQALTNQAGEVHWQASYTPFGDASLIVENIENNLRFAGQYFDGETGKHYNGARDYDSSTGRYLQSDPIGLGDGPNTYGYVGQNPLIYIDIDGEKRRRVGPPNSRKAREVAKIQRRIQSLNSRLKNINKTQRESAEQVGALSAAIEELSKTAKRLNHPNLPMKCAEYKCPWDQPACYQSTVSPLRTPENNCRCVRYDFAK